MSLFELQTSAIIIHLAANLWCSIPQFFVYCIDVASIVGIFLCCLNYVRYSSNNLDALVFFRCVVLATGVSVDEAKVEIKNCYTQDSVP